MRLILQFCLLLLVLLGTETHAWGKVDVGQNIASGGLPLILVDCTDGEAPPALITQGEPGPWDYEPAPDVCNGPNLYAYVQQNPWTGWDPDGLKTTAKTEAKKVEKKFLIFKWTKEEKVTTIKVTGTVVDSSSAKRTKEQQEALLKRIESQIEKDYTGKDGKHQWKTEVDLTLVKNKGKASKDDHVFEIVDAVPGAGPGTLGKVDKIGGKQVYIRSDLETLKPESPGNASFERTASHEFGHTAGLRHPKPYDPGNTLNISEKNLMNQTANSGSHRIEKQQIEQIQKDYDAKNLNQD